MKPLPTAAAGSTIRARFVSSMIALLVLAGAGERMHLQPVSGQDQNATIGGEIEIAATFENIGIRWPIEGDANRDGRVSVRYRPAGEADWRAGLPLMRSHPNLEGEGGDRSDNRWAGSVFWLEPGREYELELRLEDPDGGSETRVVRAATRGPLFHAGTVEGERLRYVVPGGGGGGTGSREDPFRGLQAAADAAVPGDRFEIAAGTYRPFELLASGAAGAPIVFIGPRDGTGPAVVDGGGTDRGIITLGRNDRTIERVVLEHLTLTNGRWGIDAQRSHDIQVRFLRVTDVDDGYVNRRDGAQEGNQTICDSVFVGRVPWPGSGIPSERGIDLRGDGNVVCNNRVSRFGDGVSLQPSTSDAVGAWGNDVYGNDIFEIVDDPIEIDYNDANVRVWGNRVTSGRMGISLAPVYGGPAYVFRNTFFSLESSAYKMNREPAGLFIAHNSSLKRGNATSSPAGWQNTFLRNNFLFGTRYLFEEYGLVEGSVDDWDFDAWAREPACGGDTPPCFKWEDRRYATLADLRAGAGIETNGIEARRDDLVAAPLPEDYRTPVAPEAYDLRLRAGAPEIDAGDPLANLNAPWVRDGKPDIGAHELGAELPTYGPRPPGAPIPFLGRSPDGYGRIYLPQLQR